MTCPDSTPAKGGPQASSTVRSVKPQAPLTPTRHIRQQWALNRQAWLDRLSQWNPHG